MKAQCSALTSEDDYASMLVEAIREGLEEQRWGWRRSIAPALTRDLEDDSDTITLPLINRLIAEAETSGAWPKGWADEQLAIRRKSFMRRGEDAGNATLNAGQVRVLRRRYANRFRRGQTVTIAQLAGDYRISATQVKRIGRYQHWRHL